LLSNNPNPLLPAEANRKTDPNMKTFFPLLPVLFLSLLSSAAYATNYTNNGSTQQAYALYSGDSLRITSGTYVGSITSFTNGAVIIVSAGATFKPSNFHMPAGRVINYGSVDFGTIGTYGGFRFDNFNLLNVNGDLSLYDGATQIWNNNVAAMMRITGSFSMNNAVFTNASTLTVGGSFTMYTATSRFINRSATSITGDLSINNGVLTNQNRLSMNNLNAWGGEVVNEGSISPRGNLTFSNGTSYTNQCLLVARNGFTNYGNFSNNGLLWVGTTNTASDHFYNSGTFTNAAGATVRTVRFTNYNTLAGAGNYYITGESYTSGTVGRSGSTTDTIVVYDVTRSNASRIFDTQWGSVHPNVVYRVFQQPDTNKVNYSGCSSFYRSSLATPLPVIWESFDAKVQQGNPVLSWSANYEADSRFDVQRSFDNIDFVTINSQPATTSNRYTYTDNNVERATVIYYRVKATSRTGAVTYTETKSIRLANESKAELSVYPNPVKDQASIQFKAQKNELVTISISNMAGQPVSNYTVNAKTGTNLFTVPTSSGLQAGVYFITLKNETENIAVSRFVKN